jgi:RNA polymerase sigma factor (sigma-70 family)
MNDAAHLTIDELATQCREESGRPGREPAGGFSSCWELFRRAVVENDQQAWQALYAQYRRLVGKWAAGADLELDDLVTEAFARFWQGVRNHDFAVRFPTIKAVMSYLKRCARALAIDAARRQEYQQLVWEALVQEADEADDPPDDVALERVFSQELRDYLHGQMRDEQEHAVFKAYCRGLKPREIAEQHPDLFANVGQIYRVRERIVSRLAADPMVQKWWTS